MQLPSNVTILHAPAGHSWTPYAGFVGIAGTNVSSTTTTGSTVEYTKCRPHYLMPKAETILVVFSTKYTAYEELSERAPDAKRRFLRENCNRSVNSSVILHHNSMS